MDYKTMSDEYNQKIKAGHLPDWMEYAALREALEAAGVSMGEFREKGYGYLATRIQELRSQPAPTQIDWRNYLDKTSVCAALGVPGQTSDVDIIKQIQSVKSQATQAESYRDEIQQYPKMIESVGTVIGMGRTGRGVVGVGQYCDVLRDTVRTLRESERDSRREVNALSGSLEEMRKTLGVVYWATDEVSQALGITQLTGFKSPADWVAAVKRRLQDRKEMVDVRGNYIQELDQKLEAAQRVVTDLTGKLHKEAEDKATLKLERDKFRGQLEAAETEVRLLRDSRDSDLKDLRVMSQRGDKATTERNEYRKCMEDICASIGVYPWVAREDPCKVLSEVQTLWGNRDTWKLTAAQAQENADYYRGIVVKVGDLLGPGVRTSDDETTQQDVLAAKVVEEVRSLVERLARADNALYRSRDYINTLKRRLAENGISIPNSRREDESKAAGSCTSPPPTVLEMLHTILTRVEKLEAVSSLQGTPTPQVNTVTTSGGVPNE